MAVRQYKSVCRGAGCGALVPGKGGYCLTCAKQYEKKRGSASARGYDHNWRKARLSYLRQYPVCNGEGCNRPAQVVDHIRPHKGNQTLFWDEGNWQPLCKRCHDSKTAREDGRWGG